MDGAQTEADLRAELVQKATLFAFPLADDTPAVSAARAALCGRISSAQHYAPDWLQGPIDEVINARAQAVAVPLAPDEAPAGEDSVTEPTPPGKRGRQHDAEGRDAGDDSRMAAAAESTGASA